MSSAEREKLLQTIRGLGEEEKKEIVTVLSAQLMFDELHRRYMNAQNMVAGMKEVITNGGMGL